MNHPSSTPAFSPDAHIALQRGIRQIVDAVRPTLGPSPRLVAIERTDRAAPPEILDDGALIARRIVEVPNKYENMGAMYARDMMLQVLNDVGDGTTTAAVLFQSIYDQAIRHITAGGDSRLLQFHLIEASSMISHTIQQIAIEIGGEADLRNLAHSICRDEELALLLGEIFDVVGLYGQVDIRAGHQRHSERDYVEGMYWPSGVHSILAIADLPSRRLEAKNCAVFITDLDIKEPQELIPVLHMAREAGAESILVSAMRISDRALGMLSTHQQAQTPLVIAVRTPGGRSTDRAQNMTDLAVITGGRPILQAAGQTLQGAQPDDMGFARRAWADQSHFGVAAGRGDPRTIRQHVRDLRARFERESDPLERAGLRERLGKILGGSATLRVGGLTETEISQRKQLATRTANALRSAMNSGVVPGGGVAMLECRVSLQQCLDQSTNPARRAALQILCRALEEPFRVILGNAGMDAGQALARLNTAGSGYGYDAISGRQIDMVHAGIVDSSAVIQSVVEKATHSAALALTIDVLVPTHMVRK